MTRTVTFIRHIIDFFVCLSRSSWIFNLPPFLGSRAETSPGEFVYLSVRYFGVFQRSYNIQNTYLKTNLLFLSFKTNQQLPVQARLCDQVGTSLDKPWQCAALSSQALKRRIGEMCKSQTRRAEAKRKHRFFTSVVSRGSVFDTPYTAFGDCSFCANAIWDAAEPSCSYLMAKANITRAFSCFWGVDSACFLSFQVCNCSESVHIFVQ